MSTAEDAARIVERLEVGAAVDVAYFENNGILPFVLRRILAEERK